MTAAIDAWVIDSDTHITEPGDVWTARLPAKFQDDAPHIVRDDDGRDAWRFGTTERVVTIGHTAVAGWPEPFPAAPRNMDEVPAAAYDATARLRYMDEIGVWANALYPNIGGFGSESFLNLPDPELKLACVRAYNDWLLDWIEPAPERFIPIMAIPHWDLDAAITEIDAEVDRDLDPFRQAVRQLRTIPGVSDLTAQVIVSEIGTDMTRFPTAGHLISWAGLCPRNDESAGKRRSTRLRKGAPWLKTTLVQCAWAASRKRASYLRAQYQRLRGRRGPRKAVCAVAASILTAAYHMLKDGTAYADLGPDHFDRRAKEVQARRLVRRLAELGYAVELAPLAA